MKTPPRWGWALFAFTLGAGAEEYRFDPSEFEKTPLELNGYLEPKQERFRFNQDGAFYRLNFFDQAQREALDRSTGTLELGARYGLDMITFNLLAHAQAQHDQLADDGDSGFYEAALSIKPNPGFTLEFGKIAFKWGKGYAWNPAGFVERPKDPTDPELAREGFALVAADFIHNFDGALKTIAFTPVLFPVGADVNSDFGEHGHINVAAKLYFLYRDTDIDLMYLGSGSRTRRYGADFSRNLGSQLEVHGEWAYVSDHQKKITDSAGVVMTEQGDYTSYLVGLRYLTQTDTAYILEYYRTGAGYTREEMRDFFALVDTAVAQFTATSSTVLLERARNLSQAGYGRPNPMRGYVYFRLSQKEPFDILYFTPSLAAIVNIEDHSYSLIPELLYTRITNLELRLRASRVGGDAGTDFGERQNRMRIELSMRWHF